MSVTDWTVAIYVTLFCLMWFSVFGGAALHLEYYTTRGIGQLVQTDVTVSLFALLEQYPLYSVVAGVAILLLFTFLVTSADSATFVISMMTTEGDLDPGLGMKLLWGTILGVLTVLLVLGGGLKALLIFYLSCYAYS